jgi:hypothetical protein
LYDPKTPSEITPLITFSGISRFNGRIKTFSFPGSECIEYPQDENEDDDDFSKIKWFTKRDSGLLTVTGRIDKPPGGSHH